MSFSFFIYNIHIQHRQNIVVVLSSVVFKISLIFDNFLQILIWRIRFLPYCSNVMQSNVRMNRLWQTSSLCDNWCIERLRLLVVDEVDKRKRIVRGRDHGPPGALVGNWWRCGMSPALTYCDRWDWSLGWCCRRGKSKNDEKINRYI